MTVTQKDIISIPVGESRTYGCNFKEAGSAQSAVSVVKTKARQGLIESLPPDADFSSAYDKETLTLTITRRR